MLIIVISESKTAEYDLDPLTVLSVKSAIAKKDESIADLRMNYEKAVEQNEHLQAILDMNTKSRLLLFPDGEVKNGRDVGETSGRRNIKLNGSTAPGAK